jgi:hypothetical protein
MKTDRELDLIYRTAVTECDGENYQHAGDRAVYDAGRTDGINEGLEAALEICRLELDYYPFAPPTRSAISSIARAIQRLIDAEKP